MNASKSEEPQPPVQPDVAELVTSLKESIAQGAAQTFLTIARENRTVLDTPVVEWQSAGERYTLLFAGVINNEILRLRKSGNIDDADFLIKLCKKFGFETNKANTYLLDVEAAASHDRGPTYDRLIDELP